RKEGQVVKVGEVLATIGAEGEQAEAAVPAQAEPARRPSVSVVGELPESETVISSATSGAVAAEPGAVEAMPAVRQLAKELSVDLAGIQGTGPNGRITEEDVRGAASRTVAKPKKVAKFDFYGFIDREPLKGIRRSTAKKMLEATLKAAQVTMMEDADVTELVALRERLKAMALEQRKVKLTYLPFIIKAVTMALKNNKYLNASIDEETEEILIKKYYNIGIAVAIEDGLMVPVIKEADAKEFMDLAVELAEIIGKAKERKVDLADLKGGTFTITNWGTLSGTYGTPIVNFPEAAILGVGRIRELPWVKDGKIEIRKMMPLSLTWDHRILDGAQAASFMNELVRYLEKPEIMMAMH
ncbi:MAG: 2-oxo acid dehydrogenase subunit E2, partial [Methanomassiliicoccales archaeon]|nr:2-oxo acid dehydrogenase subunit E2 [Methanomassiliicoccales archaeon]